MVTPLTELCAEVSERWPTGSAELDQVLGGGLLAGAVVLIGGDPGIGKSTLLLDCVSRLAQHKKSLYVTGEESLQQISTRAERLGVADSPLLLLAETSCERILQVMKELRPEVVVIDSVQTLFTEGVSSAPGSVSQVRESAAQLVQAAKQSKTALFLVGHVTKEGVLAGPRVLEHMVDTVLYFEGRAESPYRLLRAMKNRFGAVNELGVFAMTEKGLKEVKNPSAIFLSRTDTPVEGSVVMVTWEGTRPLLVEVQALVDSCHSGAPRRLTVGVDPNRLALILAVLHRHGGVATYDQDVFLNVVGGVRITETAVDLAALVAVVSSLRKQPVPPDLVVFGEVGLSSEIRPVQGGTLRLKEASKQGFTKALVPKANLTKNFKLPGMELMPVGTLTEALSLCFNI